MLRAIRRTAKAIVIGAGAFAAFVGLVETVATARDLLNMHSDVAVIAGAAISVFVGMFIAAAIAVTWRSWMRRAARTRVQPLGHAFLAVGDDDRCHVVTAVGPAWTPTRCGKSRREHVASNAAEDTE